MIGLALALLATGPAWAGDVPLGHRDFYPSPQRPVGFRGDGSGSFPGATPVTEFWDGMPAEVERPLMAKSFGRAIDHKGKTTARVWDVTDDKAKNIVWKTRLPGWSLAGPIVVGDRVFAVGEPDWLTCLDAHTGKVLWQKRVLPLELDGRSPEEAARLQEVIDLAAAFWILRGQAGQRSMFLCLPPEECARLMANKIKERLPAWRKTIEAADSDPQLLEAFDRGAAAMARRASPYARGWGKEDMKALAADLGAFVRAVERKYRVPVATEWYGYVGNAMSTPASDGRSVFVAYGQGQVDSYDLAGYRRWGVRFAEWEHGKRGMCNLSPALCAGVLIVKSPDNLTFRGLDADTGRLLWERKAEKSHGYYTATALTLRGPNGRVVRAVLYPTDLTIREPHDDRLLGRIPEGQNKHLLVLEDKVWVFGYPKGSSVFRLEAQADGSISCLPLYPNLPVPEKTGWPLPNCARGAMSYPSRDGCDVFSWATGGRVGRIKTHNGSTDGRGYMGIGGYLFGVLNSSKGDNCWWRGPMSYGGGQGGEGRLTDRKAMARFGVFDVSDPQAPKTLSDRNLLQEAGPASDIYVERFFKGIDPFLFAGCYHGSASFFGLMMGTPAACGNRVFIQSAVHMRCIGDPKVPYDWNPDSRPERITKGLERSGGRRSD